MLMWKNALKFAGRYLLLLILYSFLSANLHFRYSELLAAILAVAVAGRFVKFSVKGVFFAFICFNWIPPLLVYLWNFVKGGASSDLMVQAWPHFGLMLVQSFLAALTLSVFSYIEQRLAGRKNNATTTISGLSCTLVFTTIALAPPHSQTANSPQTLFPFIETISGTSVKFEMIPISAGTISINKTAVEIKPVWIGKTEVTWDEYDVYMLKLEASDNQKLGELDAIARPTKPYGAPDRGFGHKGYPALSMTFHAAQEYCRWLSIKTGRKYRLPTEAEWEYACRAGDAKKMSAEILDKHAWFWDNAEDKTHPVATKQPNLWGLYDMLGNAVEWVIGMDGNPIVADGSFKSKVDKLDCGTRAMQVPFWNRTDPQMPKSKWWLSDATFVGFRIVCEP